MLRKNRKTQGFTLVEMTMAVGIVILLVAVSIQGILYTSGTIRTFPEAPPGLPGWMSS